MSPHPPTPLLPFRLEPRPPSQRPLCPWVYPRLSEWLLTVPSPLQVLLAPPQRGAPPSVNNEGTVSAADPQFGRIGGGGRGRLEVLGVPPPLRPLLLSLAHPGGGGWRERCKC